MDNIPNIENFREEEKGQSFHNNQTPFHNELGQITDGKSAEDIAYVERDQGRDAALSREHLLKIEYERGMTEREKRNLEISNMLYEEFPDAFIKSRDKKGNIFRRSGLFACGYFSIIEDPLVSPEEKKALKSKALSVKAMASRASDSGNTTISGLLNATRDVYFSKYGISIGTHTGNEIEDISNQDIFLIISESIDSLPDEDVERFFEVLSFLDEVGNVSKGLEVKRNENKDISDYQEMARRVKADTQI